jgi:hypothetical protein
MQVVTRRQGSAQNVSELRTRAEEDEQDKGEAASRSTGGDIADYHRLVQVSSILVKPCKEREAGE